MGFFLKKLFLYEDLNLQMQTFIAQIYFHYHYALFTISFSKGFGFFTEYVCVHMFNITSSQIINTAIPTL